MLMDCLRVERKDWSKSESTVGLAIEESMADVQGKYIMTLMSSHIHRIQQTVNAAAKVGRKVVFIGRSVERNVDVALRLKKLFILRDLIVDKRDVGDYKENQLCIIIAGSQGQEGSSLVRAIFGDHPMLSIKPKDRVVFSSDAIPGNELNYFAAIDELSRNGVNVLYPDVMPDLHQSGHGGAMEQQLLLSLVRPKFVMPIGGQDRHRTKFHEMVAQKLEYRDNEVLVPASGDVIEFANGRPSVSEHIELHPQLIDGLGVGDVGRSVLADRMSLGREGMIVLVLPRHGGKFMLDHMQIVSRGFVFMKEAQDVIEFIKTAVSEIIAEVTSNQEGDDGIRRVLERRLARRLYKIIKRSPMVLPVFVEE